MKQRMACFLFVILCFLMPQLCAAEENTDFNLADSPAIKSLAASADWLALGHYRPRLFGQTFRSTIDSSNFFLAANGKTDPKAELKATLALFQSTEKTTQQCLFPARYLFLKKHSLISTPYPVCPEYEQFRHDLNPTGVTLIYTDVYMNNPSSLFGHTLMRIDVPEQKTQLVAHGMNYGAYVDPNTAGIFYALYGLTGGYYGGFTVKPYYNIINTYNNLENRDIREYTLNLSDEELTRFVAHLWEVGHTQTRYYFFTQNCSYLLMEVLDAVRPSLKLADDFPAQTIPADTVKSVNKRALFVRKSQYRPSRQKRIDFRYKNLTQTEQDALLAYLFQNDADPLLNLSENSRVNVLDTAYEYVQYAWIKQRIPLTEYRQKSLYILKERRNIVLTSKEVDIPEESILNAHDSMRIHLSTGSESGTFFNDFGWRAAYHDLTESPTGLLTGAEINFLDTVLRYYPSQNNLKFQKSDLIKITSLAPYTPLFHPISYQVHTYIDRKQTQQANRNRLMYTLKGGSGLTVEPLPRTYLYALVNTLFRYGGKALAHHQGIALGSSAGILTYFSQAQLKAELYHNYSDNKQLREYGLQATLNFRLSQNMQIGYTYHWEKSQFRPQNELKFTFSKYF